MRKVILQVKLRVCVGFILLIANKSLILYRKQTRVVCHQADCLWWVVGVSIQIKTNQPE